MNELQEFIKLSKILTGFKAEIEALLAGEYYGRLKAEYPAELTATLTSFSALKTDSLSDSQKEKAVKNNLLAKNFDIIHQVINIWYTSRFANALKATKDATTVNQHKKALMWELLQAPPRAFSEKPAFGVYGYWKNKPKK